MRRAAAVLLALALVPALALAGCTEGAVRADLGTDARLRVPGATFVRGPWPDAADGPAVEGVLLANASAVAGTVGRRLSGTLAPGAETAVVRLEGDVGYWIVRAGVPGLEAPGRPTFALTFELAATLAPGPYSVEVRAADAEGRFGAASATPLEVLGRPSPTGALVFRLTWDRNADLDLHVLDGSGEEIFHRDKSSRPSNVPPSVDAGVAYGVLDIDSNARCSIDGRREENVVYAASAPAGRYVVRVDTFGMCGEDAARWTVQAIRDGQLVAEQRGTAVAYDTTYPHDRGAGVVALELDLP